MQYITLDMSKTKDIKKAIILIEKGYFILNSGLNLITLKK